MRTPLLYGEYELTIDDKNRMLIPSEIRRSMVPQEHGEAFFLIIGINRVPWLYPELYYHHLLEQMQPEMRPGADMVAFNQRNFAMASRIEWDKQGRVLVPEKVLRRAGLNRDVTLIGARDHLELFNRQDWEQRREALLSDPSLA